MKSEAELKELVPINMVDQWKSDHARYERKYHGCLPAGDILYHIANTAAAYGREQAQKEVPAGKKLVDAGAVVLHIEDAEQIERIATLPISTHARLIKAIEQARGKNGT